MAGEGEDFGTLIRVLDDAIVLLDRVSGNPRVRAPAAQQFSDAAKELRQEDFANLRADLERADKADIAAAGFSPAQLAYKVEVTQVLLQRAQPDRNAGLTEEKVGAIELAINAAREIAGSLKKLSIYAEAVYELLGLGLNAIKAVARRVGGRGTLMRLRRFITRPWRKRPE